MRKKRRKRIRIIHIFLLLAIVYVSAVMLNQRKLSKDLQAKKVELQDEISSIETDINMLNNDLDSSDSLEFVERVAREELRMVKPREIIYIDKNKVKNSFFDDFGKDSN